MFFREATITDIPQIQFVRNAVKENVLSNPALVSDADVENYITKRGRGWVCEIDSHITGFAIADLQDNNIWALFVHPDFESRGIGKKLHSQMLNWYFGQNKNELWLSTSPGTRAEKFYRKAGWRGNGIYGKGEIRFEMTKQEWLNKK
jgi:GNAT superfamily N-acetyltransferase